MAGIVEFPQVVEEALRDFGDLLPNEPQRRHFAEYLTGLYVAARKKVSAINREFATARDQSCLNRFLTEATWDVGQLNQRRLDLLQDDPSTRYSEQGSKPFFKAAGSAKNCRHPRHAQEKAGSLIAPHDNSPAQGGPRFPVAIRAARR